MCRASSRSVFCLRPRFARITSASPPPQLYSQPARKEVTSTTMHNFLDLSLTRLRHADNNGTPTRVLRSYGQRECSAGFTASAGRDVSDITSLV